MKRNQSRLGLVGLVLILIGAGMAPGFAGSESQRKAEELEAKIAELTRLRSQIQAQRAREATADSQFIKAQRELREQLKASEQGLADRDSRCQALKKRVANLEQGLKTAESATDVLKKALEAPLGEYASQLSAGLPWQREAKLEALQAIQESVATATAASDLKATFQWIQVDFQALISSEAWNAPVYLDNGQRRLQVDHFRLGLIAQGFVAEDNSMAELQTAYAGKELIKLDASNPAQRAQILQLRQLIESLAGRRSPALTIVPLPAVGSQGR